jgi:SAM-dependent methyltransferase
VAAEGEYEIDFWEDPEQVARFADREPDRRLVELLKSYADPASARILDIGCAGGRNTLLLAAAGFDVHALDASHAMIKRTRARVARMIGPDEAERRIRVGPMDDLDFASRFFDLIVALGVYHNAHSPEEWNRTLAETSRVLKPRGLLLVANFARRIRPEGVQLTPVPDLPHVYEGLPSGRVYLIDAIGLDAAMATHGLDPERPTRTVEVVKNGGLRVTVNGLYRKREAPTGDAMPTG